MKKIPLFDSALTCPKCGGKEFTHRFRREGTRGDFNEPRVAPQFIDCCDYVKKAHMRSICSTCRYEHYSLPLDTQREVENV